MTDRSTLPHRCRAQTPRRLVNQVVSLAYTEILTALDGLPPVTRILTCWAEQLGGSCPLGVVTLPRPVRRLSGLDSREQDEPRVHDGVGQLRDAVHGAQQ